MTRRPGARGRRHRRREREPRLVLRFAVFTALGLALAAAVILVLVRDVYTVQAERQAIGRARVAADTVLRGRLRTRDLTGQVSAARRLQLDRLFDRNVLVHDMVAGTLYDGVGRVTYSHATDGRFVAPREGLSPYVREALDGHVVSHVVPTREGRVLRTLLPVNLTSGDGVEGALALDQDYGPISSAARRSSYLIAGVLEGLLVVLFTVLLPVLMRATARIRRHIAELDHIATHDDLTGLLNRPGFRRGVTAAADDHAGAGAVLLADIDGFHEINDTLGSDAGDSLLEEVAARLQRDLAGTDLIGRMGEDEFAVLCRAGSEAEITHAAERLRMSLARPFFVRGVRVGLDARVGAAVVPEGGSDVDTILRRAGVALSVAKGRQTSIEMYDPAHDAADVARLELTAELREALATGQLTVHYQPQADLATRAIRGVEALIRWQHPRRGLLTATEFIALAERTGLITEIGHFVLEAAAQQWHELDALGIRFDVAVNLAAVDLLEADLPNRIAETITMHDLPPEYLVLEITERTLLRDERRTNAVLKRLNGIGVRLAIDDFGTGYSSLAYLRRLPIQQVKLDRSFVSEIPGDASSEAIIRSTIELAHTLNATVIAEGVETREQWEHLAGMGCDIAQGYLIGRALPGDELVALVNARPGYPVVVAA